MLYKQQCDAAYGMKAFFQMLDEEPAKIILFGDACPAVTDPIAKASKFFQLIQVTDYIPQSFFSVFFEALILFPYIFQ